MKVSGTLEPERKAALGQFMTPSAVADFMASLFTASECPATLLDAGAGIGSLTIAAVARLRSVASVDAWELDPFMRQHLEPNLAALGVEHRVHGEDFITAAVHQIAFARGNRYTHAILNPPYKKLNTHSAHRALLRKVGIETVNLYSAFVALAVLLMQHQGQLIAIVPRSFCNGPYYRPFRRFILQRCSLDRIHVFGSRDKAFRDDSVLQENVIVKLVKGQEQGDVTVTCSQDEKLTDYREKCYSFRRIVKPADPEAFIHIPIEHDDVHDTSDLLWCSLDDLGLEVSTGPVVDFRLRKHWLAEPTPYSVPLIYPHHFSGGLLHYPRRHKKPNALEDCKDVQQWLMPNDRYVLVKRFSSKEEKRRVVAYVYSPETLRCEYVGFENHWNVFHSKRKGIDPVMANGLACFLNSTLLDRMFRVFSGHTQVNATDLRNLKYPPLAFIRILGETYRVGFTQTEIDDTLRKVYEQNF